MSRGYIRMATYFPLTALALGALALSACRDKADAARLPATADGGATVAGSPSPTPPSPVPAPAPAVVATPTPPPAATPTKGRPAIQTLSGAIEPHRRATLAPRVSGSIARVHVREGDVVGKGAALVSLDLGDFQLRLEQAKTGLDAARVQEDAAKVELERTRRLVAEKTSPESQLDGARARHDGARAQTAQAAVALAMAKKALEDAVVRAPFAGLVARRLVSEGEYAAVMPPTPLVVLEETGVYDVRIQVPSSELGKIKPGDPLAITVPATGLALEAKVRRVVGSLDPQTRTFSIIAEVPGREGLRPGLYVEARLGSAR